MIRFETYPNVMLLIWKKPNIEAEERFSLESLFLLQQNVSESFKSLTDPLLMKCVCSSGILRQNTSDRTIRSNSDSAIPKKKKKEAGY